MRRAIVFRSLMLASALVMGSAAADCQDLERLSALILNPSATVGDLGSLLRPLSESSPDPHGYRTRLEAALSRYDPDQALTKGKASLVAYRALGLRSSFAFLLFPTERNAFRAFIMEGAFGASGSPGEVLGGLELFDFVNSVSDLAGRGL